MDAKEVGILGKGSPVKKKPNKHQGVKARTLKETREQWGSLWEQRKGLWRKEFNTGKNGNSKTPQGVCVESADSSGDLEC